MKTSNWGNYPQIDAQVHEPQSLTELKHTLKAKDSLITRGNGRCYGDSSLAPQILSTRHLSAITAFDPTTGLIEVQAGILLDDLLRHIVPQGWFLPVVPGTKMITVGGAIASNVHGKNHHRAGAFGEYVLALELMDESGEIKTCTTEENAELFAATVGGLGLSGIIISATLRLKRIETSYFQHQSFKAHNLAEMLGLMERRQESPYLVAWLDGLVPVERIGAGILLVGQECPLRELPIKLQAAPLLLHRPPKINIPKLPVSWLMNQWSLRLNNALYRWQHRHFDQTQILHYSQFFFPLDALHTWKNLYGPPGLLQYQFVVPKNKAQSCIQKVLERIQQARVTPYLIVLKMMGKSSTIAASTDFPMPGYSLAIDFKNTARARDLLHDLDQIVLQGEGRVYLTKDSRLPADVFAQMYPEAAQQPAGKFRSLQSERIYDL